MAGEEAGDTVRGKGRGHGGRGNRGVEERGNGLAGGGK